MSLPWVKLSVGLLDHPRYAALRPGAALTYITLNMLVGKLGTSGALETLDGFVRLDARHISKYTGLRLKPQKLALKELDRARLLSVRSNGSIVVNAAIFRGDRIPLSPAVRQVVLQRDEFACVKCGATDLLEVDHIIAVAFGGDSSLDNLQTLCRTCNRKKGPHRNAALKAVFSSEL